MAVAFKNAGVAISDSTTDIYTCPASTEAVVFSLYLSNIDGINNADVDILVYDNSATATKNLGMNIPIVAGSTLSWDKIVLEANDKLQARANAAGDVEAFASILEMT